MMIKTENKFVVSGLVLAASLLTATHGLAGVLSADLSVSITDGNSAVTIGDSVTYTIVAGNAGANDVTGATISNALPAGLACTWTCSASAGSSCTATGNDGVNDTLDLLSGGTATYTLSCSVTASASNPLNNSVSIAAPGGVVDPDALNNSAMDSSALSTPSAEPIPVLGLWGLTVLIGGVVTAGLRQVRRRLSRLTIAVA